MPAEIERRVTHYQKFNCIDNFLKAYEGEDQEVKYPTTRFFQENKTEIFELDFNGENFEMFESMRIYIERNGRPYNYIKSVKELNSGREDHLQEEQKGDESKDHSAKE